MKSRAMCNCIGAYRGKAQLYVPHAFFETLEKNDKCIHCGYYVVWESPKRPLNQIVDEVDGIPSTPISEVISGEIYPTSHEPRHPFAKRKLYK